MYTLQDYEIEEEKNAGRKNNGYSIHTFEVVIPLLNQDAFIKYKSLLENRCTKQDARSGYHNQHYYMCLKKRLTHAFANHYTCFDNEDLFRLGISNLCLMKGKYITPDYQANTGKMFISFQVNPRILLGHTENKYICIIPCSEIEQVIPALFATLRTFGFEDDVLIATEIKRLDLCANIRLKDQPAAERYLKLMRKGGHYRGLNTKEMPLDPVSHRHKHPGNEVRYVNGSYSRNGIRETLSIYLKYPQMQERSYLYDAGEIEQAKGQVRFELRVKAPKLRYLKKKYARPTSIQLLDAVQDIGIDILGAYLGGIYGTGKFVKTSHAIELVKQTNCHHKQVKGIMSQIIRQARKTDIAEAFHILPPQQRYMFKTYFNRLGISPVTFPDSWEEEAFENPATYILNNNVNERKQPYPS